MKTLLAFFAFVFSSQLSFGASAPIILSYGSDHGSWPAENLCFPANAKLVAYQGGWLLPHTCVGGTETKTQIWFVKGTQAVKVGESAEGNFLTDPATGPAIGGDTLAFAEFSTQGTTSVSVGGLSHLVKLQLPSAWPAAFVKNFNVISANEIQFRMMDENRVSSAGFVRNGTFTRLEPKGVSFYYGAATSSQLRLEKIRFGEPGPTSTAVQSAQAEAIAVGVAPSFAPVFVARDRDADPKSPFKSFYNSGSVQGRHWAFFAVTDQGPALLRGLDTKFEVVPLAPFFATVDYFAPAVLSDGRVALRAVDHQGLAGVWVIDLKNQAQLILKRGQALTTQRGSFVIGKDPFVTGPATSGLDVVIGVSLDDAKTAEPLEQDVVQVFP